MRKKKPDPSRCAEQRNKAEIPVAEGEGVAPSRSGRDLTGLVRELQKHQIELETENEELRKAREAIEESRARYADLYDSAPMGCFSLDDEGRIQEANLTGARLLGSERSHLKDTSLAHFLAPQSRGAFDAHRRAVLRNGSRESRELEFERRDGTRFWGLL
ncbi:MAG: PAS domain-containing protein, partial [Syntrophales bacterium LBB04]|nr:PAS domain-containing protein [Syntrophales bacterium LBB04]